MNLNDRFLRGEIDDYFTLYSTYSDSASKYTPLQKGRLSRGTINSIFTTTPELKTVVAKWQANVGSNDTRIVTPENEVSDRTKQTRDQLKKRLYRLLYSQLNWKQIELQIIEFVAKEGNAIIMLNQEGQVIVESIYRFNVYWDSQQKTATYNYVVDGAEKIKGLKHMEDLYHIKDPVAQSLPIAPSRIESIYTAIVMRQNGLTANAKIMEGGFIGKLVMKVDKDEPAKSAQFNDKRVDSNGKTFMQRTLEQLKDWFGGVRNAGTPMISDGLTPIELGKNNRDMQFLDLIRLYTPETIAWAYGLVLADFGAGANVTYDNANTFDAALYDKFGRAMERIIDHCRNEFILKKLFNISISENLYVEYIEPEDPNKIAENTALLEEWKNDTITLNEFREKRGLEPLPNGDVTYSAWLKSQAPAPEPTLPQPDPSQPDAQQPDVAMAHFEKKTFKSPTEKALDTEIYSKFLARWEKALTKQITDFTSSLDNLSEITPESVSELKPIESFYSFPTLKKDLARFAVMGMEEFTSHPDVKKKGNYTLKFSDDPFGVLTQEVIDYLDQRTEALLKGDAEFKSLDAETAAQIETIIKDNMTGGVSQITKALLDAVGILSKNRASLIAETEAANALEGTSWMMFKDEFKGGEKEWYSVMDNRVRDSHRSNERQGRIPIEKAFASGEMRAGSAPRCRCTVLYYPPDDYLD